MASDKKHYLTKEGLDRIKKEYQRLLKQRKIRIKKEAPPILHSEELNAEFVSFREDFEYIESRIAELERILNNFELVKSPPRKEKDKIQLGAKVVVEVDGQKDEFYIVDTLEANPSAGKISNMSPVGKALINKKKGEEVTISSPTKVTYKIKEIKY